jgi:hypothetical protein
MLYTGTLVTENFVSDGTPFQQFSLGRPDSSMSNLDLLAIDSNNVNWAKTELGLWRYGPTDNVFYENTDPSGRTWVLFGDGNYGAIPAQGATINFYYALIDTALDQTIASGTNVTSASNPNIVAVTTSGLSGYQEALSTAFYKQMSPALFSAQERAVTRLDHKALVQTYPGVIDNVMLGQAEVNPGDLRWMNVITCCILTNPVWTTAQWNAFVSWYETNVGMSALSLFRKDPTQVSVNLVVNIYCYQRATLQSVETQALSLITAYYQPKMGSLGGQYYTSDITSLLTQNITDSNGSLIDYFGPITPERPMNLKNTQYVNVASVAVNTYYSTRRDAKLITIL